MSDESGAYYRRKPTQERSIRRVAQVLDATRAGILANGYDALTMHEIASRAGMQRSAIYRYFSGKPAIMVSLIELHHSDIHNLAERLFGDVTDRDGLVRAIEHLVQAYFLLFLDDPVLPAIWMGAQSAPELFELCAQENARAGAVIAQAMARAHRAQDGDQTKAILLLELIGAAARLALQKTQKAARDQVETTAKTSAVAVVLS
ncbi:TetR/AcrR family transcriptional regulator [uncultured Roseobacter sp.]|uniref:TetR/AcrR family transcriptional regulator n=1 Tax=uncultured Roseobacter sp. TaxID=114847 RepID=UPI002605D8FD|nr:TetR/AcrR family transcriptional regulator [uncultured Roseobacter sp.]